MAKAVPKFEALKAEYARLWASMETRSSKDSSIELWAKQVIAFKSGRYAAVEKLTGVPWYIVGIIHLMEAGLAQNKKTKAWEPRFDCHLHNGDPIGRKTVQVPAGRPPLDKWTWTESAADALNMKNLSSVKEWTIERIAYQLEAYNGWGYRWYHADVLTPYLWSFTNHYAIGKYAHDGKWDAKLVSGQAGAMALLKKLMELDPEIVARVEADGPIARHEELVDDPAMAFPRAEPVSTVGTVAATVTDSVSAATRSVTKPGVAQDLVNAGAVLAAGVSGVLQGAWNFIVDMFGVLPSLTTEVGNQLESAKKVTGWFSPDPSTWIKISAGMAATLLIVALLRRYKPGSIT